MYRGTMSLGTFLISVTVCACVAALQADFPSERPSPSHQHLLQLAKVLNTLRKLELSGKGTVSHALKHGRLGGNRVRGDYQSHESSKGRSRASSQNEAEKFNSLESYLTSSQDGGEGLAKRQGGWDYDYGLGGGRFGKRTPGDYGIGGGRFGRDVSDVDHVDLSDAE